MSQTQLSEIMPLIYATEIRDAYTQGHSEHVAYYAKELALAIGLNEKEAEDVYTAGLLHDIGKIGIPDSILLKPGKLEDEEYKLIQLHSHISGEIIEKLQSYAHLKSAIRHHHENYAGDGYPDGLKGDAIPLYSRILALADVFDALTTARIYRSAINFETALEIMDEMQKEKKFDPVLYKQFILLIKKIGIVKIDISTKGEFKELEDKRNNFFFSDHLTHLLNRDALLALLRKSHDYKYHVSLIACNILEFKQYNQRYGIYKGDLLLKNIAKTLKEKLHANTQIKEPKIQDLFAFRLNGDRFIVLYIGDRSEYLKYKLSALESYITQKFSVAFESTFIIKQRVVDRNIEEEIGYLL
jgi:diguanylate cyclase (GGDEF)-like protein